MTNREIAIRVLEEIELLQQSSAGIGIPWRQTALAIIEDGIREGIVTDIVGVSVPPIRAEIPFEWPENGVVK